MNYLSNRVLDMAESQTIAMAQKSRELIAEGKDIISLSLGEPDFNIPDAIKQAAHEAIDKNYSKYMPVSGYQELKEAICVKFKRDNGLDYKPGQIVVSTGAKQSLANVMLSLLNEGDEVIVPAPFWVSYQEMIRLAGGTTIVVPTTIEEDFKISPEKLAAAITDKSKIIIYSSPCNPSGSVYSQEELEALAAVILKHEGLFVIADEIYELINFAGRNPSMAAIKGMYERTVTVNGVSKGFAMTGWRIGYLGAPEWIAKACDKVQGQITSGASAIAQRATIKAVLMDPKEVAYMREGFRKRRDMMLELLGEIPGLKLNKPKGAFYLFPDVSAFFGKSYQNHKIENASDLCLYLINEAHVAIVTGEAFGADECVRISYASSEEVLREAVKRLKLALSKLN